MNKTTNPMRWQLLSTVSVMALLGSLGIAQAADDSRAELWIEAGGQFEQLSDRQEPYAPPFIAALLTNPFTPPSKVQVPPGYSFGEEASITFRPENSDWLFSVGVRYGRANGNRRAHQETSPPSQLPVIVSVPYFGIHISQTRQPLARRFATTVSQAGNKYLVLDFEAGKDVGLGMVGANGSSIISAGVRFAQFSSHSDARIDGDPNFLVSYKYASQFNGYAAYIKIPAQSWDLYAAKMNVSRSFNGVGPTLKWDTSTLLAGRADSGEMTFDWGVNGAVLFGRQRVRAHQETMAHHGSSAAALPLDYQASHDITRSRSVAVPNLGGFAGLSLRYPNAKISLGYRVDYYFNAMDGGLATAKKEDRGFYGPFASISFGLGD